MKLVVGLGNPGTKYGHTRHNAGFIILDRFSDLHGIPVNQTVFNALTGKGKIDGETVILAEPQTFMNASGLAVKRLVDYFKITETDLIVLHDEMDLPFGTIRLKFGGGHGGHRGLLSLIDELGYNQFSRLRFGIGKPPRKSMVEGYVLERFSDEEKDKLAELVDTAAMALREMIASGIHGAMRKYNQKNDSQTAR